MKVAGWAVEAERELGRDDEGYVYYLLNHNVYRNQAGGTRWVCTEEAWGRCGTAYRIQVTP